MKDTASASSSAGKRSCNNAPAQGIRLLSPTSLQVARSTSTATGGSGARQSAATPTTAAAKGFGASRVTTAKGADFDFNTFTLESVRSTVAALTSSSSNCSTGSTSGSSAATTTSNTTSSNNSSSNNNSNNNNNHARKTQRKVSTASSDGGGPSCLSSQAEKFADAQDALDGTNSFHTMRSTEDFDALENRRRHPSTASSGLPARHPSSNNSSNNSNSKQSASSSSAPVTAAAVVPRKKTTVVMAGWLQKRKGLVLKRWKAYYCLLRDDDQLCLYASEDTINGRVELRFQVLRVLLTDKSDAFHVIGVSGDGTPRKDEFRALHSMDWSRWFRALRGYLDAASLQGVMHRKPELSELSPASSSGSEGVGFGYDKFGAVAPVLGGKSSSNQQQQQRASFAKPMDPSRESFEHAALDELLAARSTLSALSGFSGVSSWTNQSCVDDAKLETSSEVSDCPIIEPREPHLAMLEPEGGEQQRTSESTVSRDSDGVKSSEFSW